MAVRELGGGRRAAAFSFDLHDTNLPLQIKYLRLISELILYTVPPLIERTDYDFGTTVSLAAPGSGSLYVDTPEGGLRIVEMRNARGTFIPDTLGVYTAVTSSGFEEGERAEFYVHIPEGEYTGEKADLQYEVFVPDHAEQVREATREITFFMIIAALVLLLLEWGLYIYEQY